MRSFRSTGFRPAWTPTPTSKPPAFAFSNVAGRLYSQCSSSMDVATSASQVGGISASLAVQRVLALPLPLDPLKVDDPQAVGRGRVGIRADMPARLAVRRRSRRGRSWEGERQSRGGRELTLQRGGPRLALMVEGSCIAASLSARDPEFKGSSHLAWRQRNE